MSPLLIFSYSGNVDYFGCFSGLKLTLSLSLFSYLFSLIFLYYFQPFRIIEMFPLLVEYLSCLEPSSIFDFMISIDNSSMPFRVLTTICLGIGLTLSTQMIDDHENYKFSL